MAIGNIIFNGARGNHKLIFNPTILPSFHGINISHKRFVVPVTSDVMASPLPVVRLVIFPVESFFFRSGFHLLLVVWLAILPVASCFVGLVLACCSGSHLLPVVWLVILPVAGCF